MIYCIICILILILSYIAIYNISDDETASVIVTLLSIVFVGTPFINQFIGEREPIEYQETECTITGLELTNNESENLKGMFILGSGTIKGSKTSKQQYVFFANTEYGKQLRTINVDTIYLKETDNEEPKLINIKQKRTRKLNWIDYLWGNKAEEETISDILKGQILVIPTNTIKIDYNVEI